MDGKTDIWNLGYILYECLFWGHLLQLYRAIGGQEFIRKQKYFDARITTRFPTVPNFVARPKFDTFGPNLMETDDIVESYSGHLLELVYRCLGIALLLFSLSPL